MHSAKNEIPQAETGRVIPFPNRLLQSIERLVNLGVSVHLLKPKSKAPKFPGWSTAPKATYAQMIAQYAPGDGFGARLGAQSKVGDHYLAGFDFDLWDRSLEQEALSAMGALFPGYADAPSTISGSGRGAKHFFALTEEPMRSRPIIQSSQKVIDAAGRKHAAWSIALYGSNTNLVLPGSVHPDSGIMYWPGKHKLGDMLAAGTVEILSSALIESWPSSSQSAPKARGADGAPKDRWQAVNAAALADIAAWAPDAFPDGRWSSSAWRVSSEALGRDFQEDLSIHAYGITDFGPEREDGKRIGLSAIQLLRRHFELNLDGDLEPVEIHDWVAESDEPLGISATEAARWLCEKLHLDWSKLCEADSATAANQFEDLDASEGDTALAKWRGGDTHSGRVFAERHRGRLLYVSGAKIWRAWDNARWAIATNEDLDAHGKAVAESILNGAFAAHKADPDGDKGKKLIVEALRLHKDIRSIREMVESARSEPGMNVRNPSIFDKDPFLLGVPNGIVDLKTGRLIKAEPEQYITNQAAFAFDPDAKAPLWERTLNEIFDGDSDLIDLVQRLFGCCLTGDVDEEFFVFCHGPGGSGKSTVLMILQNLLKDYACSIPTAALTERGGGPMLERAKVAIIGKRGVFANETALRDVFSDEAMKLLASKDPVDARWLYGEIFTFSPSHKLWVRGNHRPGVRDSGNGFWRRMILVPFSRVFSGTKTAQLDLHKRILAEEGAGLLAWAVRGCRQWQRDGLMKLPASIERVRKDYRDSTDVFGQWLSECCAKNGSITLRRALQSYTAYLQADNHKAVPAKSEFRRSIEDRGFIIRKTNRGNEIFGLSLNSGGENSDFGDLDF